MKARIFSTVLLFSYCSVFAHPAKSRTRVRVIDEGGQLLMSAQAVRLSRGRIAVPVTAYERLGLSVRCDIKARRVAIAIRDSDSGVWLCAGSYRVRDFLHEKPGATRNDAPVAVLRGGCFYANASIVNKAFNDKFTATWDKRTHTLVLQRRKQFSQRR